MNKKLVGYYKYILTVHYTLNNTPSILCIYYRKSGMSTGMKCVPKIMRLGQDKIV